MKDGKQHRMSAEKVKALSAIGFSWALPRGCSAQLKHIKTKEQLYKAEVARREGTEYDLKEVVDAISEPVVNMPESFGKESDQSCDACSGPIPDLAQSAAQVDFEQKALAREATAVKLEEDCELRQLSSQRLEFSHAVIQEDPIGTSLDASLQYGNVQWPADSPSLPRVAHDVVDNNLLLASSSSSSNYGIVGSLGFHTSSPSHYPGAGERIAQFASHLGDRPFLA